MCKHTVILNFMEHENQRYINISDLITVWLFLQALNPRFVRYYWLLRYVGPTLKQSIVFNFGRMIKEITMFSSTITWKMDLFKPHLFKLLFILMRLSSSSLWEEKTKSNISFKTKQQQQTLLRVKGQISLKLTLSTQKRNTSLHVNYL